jgi:serine/threonine-protein kinase
MTDSKHPPASGATVVADGGPTAAVPPPVAPAATGPVPTSDLVGTLLSERYKVLKELGEGGMGTVYLAEHTTIRKKLAIKVLSSEYCHKQDLVDRFLQEARAASMISQENVVEITDFGTTPTGSVFFVMEFLDGEDLSATIKREGAQPWARVQPIMLQICRALQAAHESGIIHRDMKPENCFRIKRGKSDDFIKVLDFGIAKVTTDDSEGKGLTRTGMIFGTPEYMSPEQAQGAKPDYRVDIYALGVIMYELLTGRVPFTADTFMGILTKHMFEVPDAPSVVAPQAQIPEDVESIILKAMQKDREYRFQDMAAMATAIETAGSGSAAVSVVNEQIVKPEVGQIQFGGTPTPTPTPVPGTYPPATATGELAMPQPSSKGTLAAGIIAILLAAGGVGAYFMMAGGEPEAPAPEPAPAVAVAPPAVIQPKVEPKVDPGEKPTTPVTEKVKITIATKGIDAQILDARDDSLFGMTNSTEGFEIEKSTEAVWVTLRAPGYEDFMFEIVPDRTKSFTKTLKKEPKKRGPKRSGKKKTGKGKTPPKTKPMTPTDPKPPKKQKKPKKGVGSPDLKDPFKKH